jgi:hypothetical protein
MCWCRVVVCVNECRRMNIFLIGTFISTFVFNKAQVNRSMHCCYDTSGC